MIESIEVTFKDFATVVVIERNTETSKATLYWYDIKNGEKIYKKTTHDDFLSEQEFNSFKNIMSMYQSVRNL